MAGEDFGINEVYQKRLFVHTYVYPELKGLQALGTSHGNGRLLLVLASA
jgi:hypothetical protein